VINDRFSVLFEPVRIGPVVAPNRFFATPHTDGMSRLYPSAQARFRELKAEGGWGVVSTQEVVFDPTSDCSPDPDMVLYDDGDARVHAKIAAAIKAHGALAATELVHLGLFASCRWSRDTPIGPSDRPMIGGDPSNGPDPVSARAMSKTDIANFRRAHRNAAIAMMEVGYDIVYVYASHGISLLSHFLSPRFNTRSDEYGGNLANRSRLLREVIEETKDAIGHRCAVALRFGLDVRPGGQSHLELGEARDVVGALAEAPDLWDINLAPWDEDSVSGRFTEEGFQERYIGWVKTLTSKPVVTVGRYTSPDAMVRVVKKGLADFIGAARPSIADPFLPLKIKDGRHDDIRECIGCNICVANNNAKVPIRCTQNPTVGEEWRRAWHPEQIKRKHADANLLVVGAGPAGLELALQLGRRGYAVTLADANKEPGGRLLREAAYPGLSSWRRVIDWRRGQFLRMPNVSIYLDSRLDTQAIADFGAAHVFIATGSQWRRDGVGPSVDFPVPVDARARVFTPDDLDVRQTSGKRIAIFDDEQFYTGGLIAEACARAGAEVTLVTPGSIVSAWTKNTLEQPRIQSKLLAQGVKFVFSHTLLGVEAGSISVACVFTDRESQLHADAIVLVTSRAPHSFERDELDRRRVAFSVVGDALSPSTVAAAVYSGHRAAREFGEERGAHAPRREMAYP
jgi:dimethylamine/trimethylamine dehydrogenase